MSPDGTPPAPGILASARKHTLVGSTRLEYAVPGPSGELGYLLLAPKSEELEHDLRHDPGSGTRCWLEDRQGWWVSLPGVGELATILEKHGLMSQLWLP